MKQKIEIGGESPGIAGNIAIIYGVPPIPCDFIDFHGIGGDGPDWLALFPHFAAGKKKERRAAIAANALPGIAEKNLIFEKFLSGFSLLIFEKARGDFEGIKIFFLESTQRNGFGMPWYTIREIP